jgi:hypothetical protein
MNRNKFIRRSDAAAGALLFSPQSLFSQNEFLDQRTVKLSFESLSTKLKDVNTTNIKAAINLGCNPIINCFSYNNWCYSVSILLP